MDIRKIFSAEGLETVRAMFQAEVEPEAVDSESEAQELPARGSVRWAIIGRVQDDRSPRPEDRRMASENFDDMIRNFNREVLRVPIVAGFLPGRTEGGQPGHFNYLPPVGEVIDLSRTKINLYAKLESFIDPVTGVDRIEALIAEGFTERSLMMLRNKHIDNSWKLGHVALLSMAEAPAVENMPPLRAQADLFPLPVSTASAEQEHARYYHKDPEGTQIRFCVHDRQSATAEEDIPMPLNEKDLEAIGALVVPVREQVEALSANVEDLTGRVEASEKRTEEAEVKATEASEEASEVKAQAEETEKIAASTARDEMWSRIEAVADRAVRSGREPGKVYAAVDRLDRQTFTESEAKLTEAHILDLPIIVGQKLLDEVQGSDGHTYTVDRNEFTLLSTPSAPDEDELRVVAACTAIATDQQTGEYDHQKFLRAARVQMHKVSQHRSTA